jgi:hypothetical protein
MPPLLTDENDGGRRMTYQSAFYSHYQDCGVSSTIGRENYNTPIDNLISPSNTDVDSKYFRSSKLGKESFLKSSGII